ncbi:hypothetical protein PA40_04073 [Pseudomonas aeruginosa]|nr:hypothetical protein PA40_04073 [Pseudomonas aeruginosa]
MSNTVIVRRRVETNFTTLPNELIRDDRLSWKALGLLVYLLSLPPSGFKLHLVTLGKQRPSKRDATRTGLRELEVAGYLAIERAHDSRGRFSITTWLVSSTPFYADEPPCSGNPQTVEPSVDSPPTEMPALINTYTEQRSKEKRTTTNVPDLPRPVGLGDEAWLAIRNALAPVPPDDAKALVDELRLAMSSGIIQKSPLQWFFGVKNRYDKGGFVATAHSRRRPAMSVQVGADTRLQSSVSKDQGAMHLKQLKARLKGSPNS